MHRQRQLSESDRVSVARPAKLAAGSSRKNCAISDEYALIMSRFDTERFTGFGCDFDATSKPTSAGPWTNESETRWASLGVKDDGICAHGPVQVTESSVVTHHSGGYGVGCASSRKSRVRQHLESHQAASRRLPSCCGTRSVHKQPRARVRGARDLR
jgi:hypothetical protein